MYSLLVIDPDRTGNKLVRVLLEPEGWRVTAVEAIVEARAALDGGLAPDLIALELRLPDGDSFAYVAELAADSRTARVPVIAITSMNGSDTEQEVLRAGCAGYVRKPIDVDRFAGRLRAFIARGE